MQEKDRAEHALKTKIQEVTKQVGKEGIKTGLTAAAQKIGNDAIQKSVQSAIDGLLQERENTEG